MFSYASNERSSPDALPSVRRRGSKWEYLYVIQSTTFDGVMVYSKGKLITERGEDRFYFLVSSKRAL
jgi:hypothetical protein